MQVELRNYKEFFKKVDIISGGYRKYIALHHVMAA